MKYFLAGIMQGNLQTGMVSQDYRKELAELIKSLDKEADIHDPLNVCEHPDKLEKIDEIREVFEYNVKKAGEADIVIAYIPIASMGTGLEMLEAYKAGKTVFTISPLKTNWTVRLYSTQIFETMKDFTEFFKTKFIDGIYVDSVKSSSTPQ
ncbi:uncharacterized protein MONOS_8293 [Monocercomonoides exilis]|uniref:uncharacterized protein n=1 Tax=Monocercomonoides exilis TaxID=2049356 RepID=UPI003559EB96|nr:hypothetical protein MONOS_8293 [Monocercomonoides exilis]|eukprot:MONOS_8293.1-p1 / transcript=MONOS_8293.1 / gene=MONOS_8293 / organism=Monocercomonoides_exilis_PA203 / gene_product=unspecified product / transcript_product=unspecified product / location=Mono_scaffold00309:21906-22472(+) / protein_length=151 / sequence_SO=supercontig / SO=protein_coding / is_pseudo=false